MSRVHCSYCRLIRGHQPSYDVRLAKHALSSTRPRCDLHWRFVCSLCGRAKHFNGVSYCPHEENFFCLNCAGENRVSRRDFWAWSYYYRLKCPRHPEWHPALDRLEYSGKHPWQLKPSWRRKKSGMTRSAELPAPWAFKISPAESSSREDLGELWDEAASWWVSRYTSLGDLNREWVIDPLLLSWLGKVSGLRVLDAGCGEGYLSRILARQGAKVVGVDLSSKLIEVAKRQEAKKHLGINYRRADLSDLGSLARGSFDLVISNIVLVDVACYREAIKEIHRVLKSGGRFIFSITHPAFEAPVPGKWVRMPPDSFRIEDRRFLAVDRYFDRVTVFWGPPEGEVMVGGFHRPLRDYFEALHDAGFLVSRLEEPTPTKVALEKHFFYFADLERVPLFLIIEAVKPK